MNLLITSAGSELAQIVVHGLTGRHALRLTDRRDHRLTGEFAQSPLGHDASTNLLVRGVDAVVHVAEPDPVDTGTEYLDYMTRATYNLLLAASQEHVGRVVYLSTLDLMAAYGPEYEVTERWRPRPSPEPRLLGKHLGEIVCREFARERKLTVVALRVGMPISGGGHDLLHPMAIAAGDVAAAVDRALTAAVAPWSAIHVQGEFPGARFAIADARRILGFNPTPLVDAQKTGDA
jgi:nucleoside-diphosphate-sugar epimerase